MYRPCSFCKGIGSRIQKPTKRERAQAKRCREEPNETSVIFDEKLERQTSNSITCSKCCGSGLTSSTSPPSVNESYPRVAIIGAGIGGSALAVACFHRGIPFTLYERDINFNARSQGYGLTLQQASKAMAGLGIFSLKGGMRSTRHVVHTTDGKIVGEWGLRKWAPHARTSVERIGTSIENDTDLAIQEDPTPNAITNSKRSNIHIARQSLRKAILEQLGDIGSVNLKWGHQLNNYKVEEGRVKMQFDVNGEKIEEEADLLVGADGIRSTVRRLQIGDTRTPLKYLGCMVILGICPLSQLNDKSQDERLDSKTVFQTADGTTRIYVMPFTQDEIMWQLSFPVPESDGKVMSEHGAQQLKEEAIRRVCSWHTPIPEIVSRTSESMITGYPAYDRSLLSPDLLKNSECATVLGDAAHPMSPFKGQGANQAILDVLSLVRCITSLCSHDSEWRKVGIRGTALDKYEEEMIARSSVKVLESAAAAAFLHSEAVLLEGDMTRGGCAKKHKQIQQQQQQQQQSSHNKTE